MEWRNWFHPFRITGLYSQTGYDLSYWLNLKFIQFILLHHSALRTHSVPDTLLILIQRNIERTEWHGVAWSVLTSCENEWLLISPHKKAVQ